MRLDFNILWVEDNQGNVHSQRDRIETMIRKEGFKLRAQFAGSVDEAKSYLANDIYGDHIDLVLMDYDLGPGKKGDEGLAEVRAIFPYKDIIFYSGFSPAELMQKASLKDVQGVFAAHRNDLPEIVLGVFENLVRKVLDIDHSRGIVMGASSDIDQLLSESLGALFDGCDDEQKAEAIRLMLKRLREKRKDFEAALAEIEAIKDLNDLAKHHMVYTSDDRLRLTRKLMKILNFKPEYEPKLEEYRTDVMPKRNDLAHIRVETEGFSRKLYDRNGDEITSDGMRAVRVALLEIQELADALSKEAKAARKKV